MKKKIFLVVMISVFISGGFAQMRLDIKTKFSEKFELKGIKYGVIFRLKEEGFEIVEIDEQYCVWLKELNEERSGKDRFETNLIVSLTPPTLALEKTALLSRRKRVKYKSDIQICINDDNFLEFTIKFAEYFISEHGQHMWESFSEIEKIRAYEIGREVAREIQKMLQEL